MILEDCTYNANDITHEASYNLFNRDCKLLPIALPNYCPCCGRTLSKDITPLVAINNGDWESEYSNCENVATYHCKSCNNLFIVFTKCNLKDDGKNYDAELKSMYPLLCENKTKFDECIQNLSQDFVKIYNQAEQAESNGLDEICGIGYRKALEFLVDAYMRKENPSTSITKDASLNAKINSLKDEKIKELAKKASWLGNDQTHILCIHPNYTIADMKKFINAIVKNIETNEAYIIANQI